MTTTRTTGRFRNAARTPGVDRTAANTSAATAAPFSLPRPRTSIQHLERHCQIEQSEGDFRRFACAIHQVACDV